MEHQLQLLVGVLVKLDKGDPSATETDLIRMGEVYDRVHAAMEQIADFEAGDANFPRGMILGLRTGTPSPEDGESLDGGAAPSGFDDRDNVVFVGSAWTLTYRRKRGEI